MTILAGAVLADPPWPFDVRSPKGEGRSAVRHYKGRMTIEEIKAYPVVDMAATDSFLFLWITGPQLPVFAEVMGAWGFQYSGTAFVWLKPTKKGTIIHDGKPYYGEPWAMGGGYGTRKNAEFCLLGRRGNPKRLSMRVKEPIVALRREHSRKPDEQYERIERLVDGPYLELFARQRRPGWISLGDELDKFTEFPADATPAVIETGSVPGAGLYSSVAGPRRA
jgi:N6-adenosine-specific RNA methylase IME4